MTAAQLAGRLQVLETQIDALRQSSSWRLTAPLRLAMRWLGRRHAVKPADSPYALWLNKHLNETPPPRPKEESRPGLLVSIVMPVFNPDPRWLRAAIDSVRAQSHDDWELCIADDASTQAAVPALLQACAADDHRIKWMRRTENGHISAASNSALQLATGRWVALLDQDDLLAPHALAWVAHAIAEHPDARIVYSDEDKVDEAGRHFAPYFKPDWNSELLRGQNFVSHLGVYDIELVRAVGGFRQGFEGAQDHDLVLRAAEGLTSEQVQHVPRVLYHWRAHSGSTAGQEAGAAKSYAQGAARRAVQEHLDRRGGTDYVLSTPDGLRTVPRFFAEPPTVSVIVVGWGGAPLLQDSICAVIQRTAYPCFDVVVLDAAGGPGEWGAWAEQAGIRIVHRSAVEAFPAAMRRAVAAASGTLLCWVQAGVEPIGPGWLDELVGHARAPDVGVVGGQVLDASGTVVDGALLLHPDQAAMPAFLGLRPDSGGYFNRARLAQSFSAVSGAFALVKRSAYEDAGGFGDNPASFHLAFVDLCLRVGANGRRIIWSPYAESIRSPSFPAMPADSIDDIHVMTSRWHEALSRDPAHNPNLLPGTWAVDADGEDAAESSI